jgi:hypothetical protein
MSSEPEAPPSEAFIPKRPVWPVLLVLALVLGVGAFFGYREWRKPYPLRVLVAIDLDGYWWEGSIPAATLADRLADRLADIGLDPVRGGDPEVTKVLEKASSPEEAARKLHAAFLITATLKPEIVEHPVKGGYFEVRVDAPIDVRYLGDPEGNPGHLDTWSGAPEKPEALRLLADGLADEAFDQVLPRIVEHSTIQEIFKGNDVKLADHVSKAKNYVEYRAQRLADAKKAYDRVAKVRAEGDKGPAKVTYHSGMGAQDALGGTGAEGVLIKTADVAPFISPRTRDLGWITELETLQWRGAEGKPRVLWSGYHIYSYPSVTREGTAVLFVEDLFGWAKTLTVVQPDGKSRRVRVDPEHRFVDPKIAPGGKAAVLYDRPCRDCPGNLLVMSLEDGHPLFERKNDNAVFGGFTWIDATHVAFLVTPPAQIPADAEDGSVQPAASAKAPRQALWIVDLGTNPPTATAVLEASEGREYQSPEASHDGRFLTMEAHGPMGSNIAIYEIASKKLSLYDVGADARTPTFSPDGKTIAFVHNGDLALFMPEKLEAHRLTENPWLERYPVFSADGTRLYFESIDDDPNYARRTDYLIASAAVAEAGPAEKVTEVKP